MSSRIGQILEVLAYIDEHFDPDDPVWVAELRKRAVKEVAENRGIDPRSVHTKLTREMELEGIDEFDGQVFGWLTGNPKKLKNTLKKNTVDSTDRARIDGVFAN